MTGISPSTTDDSQEDRLTDEQRRRRARLVLAGVVVATVVLAGVTALAGGPAAAQTTNNSAGYYNNTTATVDNETWLADREDASLDDQVTLLTRVSTFIIGNGPETQGGGGPAGVLVFGLMLAGTGTAMIGRGGVGTVGGTALFVAMAAGIVQLGFAPTWMWALILLGVGAILTTAYLRSV